jgi:protein-tyrosine phosphatase
VTTAPRRWHRLDGVRNFRDLGGYEAAGGSTVRWNAVYRSDALAKLSDQDLEHLSGLNIGLVCDFRSAEERARKPNRLPPHDPPETLHLAIRPEATSPLEQRIFAGRIWDKAGWGNAGVSDTRRVMCRFYRSYVTDHAEQYGAMLRRLAAPGNHATLLHCAAGKDRTGVAAAIVLRALGVAAEQVAADYQLTNRAFGAWSDQPWAAGLPKAVGAVVEAHPDYLQAAFAAIDELHGCFEDYLRDGLGLSDADRGLLRGALLE